VTVVRTCALPFCFFFFFLGEYCIYSLTINYSREQQPHCDLEFSSVVLSERPIREQRC